MSDATFTLVCEDCGHFEAHPDPDEDGEVLTDYKSHECSHLANAELLKKLHQVKRPTHRPYIRTEVDDEVHIPDSAFRAAQFREGAVVEGAPEV